jgi:hypothetical protein
MSRCYGEPPETYPGLRFKSAIVTEDGSCHIRSSTPARHSITAINDSMLTYEITYRSTCDKEYLRYVLADSDSDTKVWEGRFAAPFRWDGKSVASSREADLVP